MVRWLPGMPLDGYNVEPPRSERTLNEYTTDQLMIFIPEATSFVERHRCSGRYHYNDVMHMRTMIDLARRITAERQTAHSTTAISYVQHTIQNLYPPLQTHVYLHHQQPPVVYESSFYTYPQQSGVIHISNNPSLGYTPPGLLTEAQKVDDESEESDEDDSSKDERSTDQEQKQKRERERPRRPRREGKRGRRRVRRHGSDRRVKSSCDDRQRRPEELDKGANEQRNGQKDPAHRLQEHNKGRGRQKRHEPEDEEPSDQTNRQTQVNKREENSRYGNQTDDESIHRPSRRSTHDSGNSRKAGGKGKSKPEGEHSTSDHGRQHHKRYSENKKKSDQTVSQHRDQSPLSKQNKYKPDRNDDRCRQEPPPHSRKSQNHQKTTGSNNIPSPPSPQNQSPKFDPYDALGLELNSPLSSIKTVANSLSLEYHPDKRIGKSEAEVKRAQYRMVEVNKAKEILLDEQRKRAYDVDGVTEDAEFEEWLVMQQGGK